MTTPHFIRSLIPRAIRRYVRERNVLNAPPKLSREEAQGYWTAPPDEKNFPDRYAYGDTKRSDELVRFADRLVSKEAAILEIGCNAVRNLNHLHRSGFTNLSAIEISPAAVAFFAKAFPEAAKAADVKVGSFEDILPTYPDRRFDLLFSMAVMMHIHPASTFLFSHMVRVSRIVLAIEDERESTSTRHFGRNYRDVFEPLGTKQILELPVAGFPNAVARAFACPD